MASVLRKQKREAISFKIAFFIFFVGKNNCPTHYKGFSDGGGIQKFGVQAETKP